MSDIKDQVGTNEAGSDSGPNSKDNVLLLIVDGGREYGDIQFKVSKTMKLGRLMYSFCRRFDVEEHKLKFLYDGHRINQDNTPKELGMENGDRIEVNQSQDGGGIITSKQERSVASLTVQGVQKS